MKKLCKLGNVQAEKIKSILKENFYHNPKRTSQFNVVTEYTDIDKHLDVGEQHWLVYEGKLDTDYYGTLMYALGMAMQKYYNCQ